MKTPTSDCSVLLSFDPSGVKLILEFSLALFMYGTGQAIGNDRFDGIFLN